MPDLFSYYLVHIYYTFFTQLLQGIREHDPTFFNPRPSGFLNNFL